jgi:hypothetical protein
MRWLDPFTGVIYLTTTTSQGTIPLVFSEQERERIELKALEQALREAHVAHAELEPLLPVDSTWPFVLTADDVKFLRFCVPDQPISPA